MTLKDRQSEFRNLVFLIILNKNQLYRILKKRSDKNIIYLINITNTFDYKMTSAFGGGEGSLTTTIIIISIIIIVKLI